MNKVENDFSYDDDNEIIHNFKKSIGDYIANKEVQNF